MSFAKSIGFEVLNLDYSPIKGPEGNIEYLMQIKKVELAEMEEDYEVVSEEEAVEADETAMAVKATLTEAELSKIKEVVNAAHASLD